MAPYLFRCLPNYTARASHQKQWKKSKQNSKVPSSSLKPEELCSKENCYTAGFASSSPSPLPMQQDNSTSALAEDWASTYAVERGPIVALSETEAYHQSEQNTILVMLRRCHCQHEMLLHCGFGWMPRPADRGREDEDGDEDDVVIELKNDLIIKATSIPPPVDFGYWSPAVEPYPLYGWSEAAFVPRDGSSEQQQPLFSSSPLGSENHASPCTSSLPPSASSSSSQPSVPNIHSEDEDRKQKNLDNQHNRRHSATLPFDEQELEEDAASRTSSHRLIQRCLEPVSGADCWFGSTNPLGYSGGGGGDPCWGAMRYNLPPTPSEYCRPVQDAPPGYSSDTFINLHLKFLSKA